MTREQADLAAIKEVIDLYAERVGTGDLDGWMSLWAEGGVQMPDDAPTRVGKSQIREAMKPAFDGMDMSITINGIQDVDVWGDHGMTRCTYSLTLTPKGGGDPIEAMPDGKALTLYERQSDGTWKIVCDCFNSNAQHQSLELRRSGARTASIPGATPCRATPPQLAQAPGDRGSP